MKNSFVLLCFLCSAVLLNGAKLVNGPMVGYTTLNEVTLWVQTDRPAQVTIDYWPADAEEPKDVRKSITRSTLLEDACSTKLTVTGLAFNTTYHYKVYIDNVGAKPTFREGYKESGDIPMSFKTKPKWRHTKDNAKTPPDFRVAFGSCAYINEEGHLWEDTKKPEYGGDYQIFESIYETKPDVMLWLGDNIYLGEADWQSMHAIHHRYTFNRKIPELTALLANTVHYAIWDDHDYGPNNTGREFWNKAMTRDAFKTFWANPPYPSESTYSFFNWADVNFYLLDNRWYRTQSNVATGEKVFFGQEQLNWLIESLKANESQKSFVYRSSFHVIACGGQILNDSPHPENFKQYTDEWNELTSRIVEEGIQNVVFISGDVHYGELSRQSFTNSQDETFVMHDFTSSPLTSGVYTNPGKKNSKRVGEPFTQRNFMTLNFSGPLKERTLTVHVHDSDGNLLNQKEGAEEGVVGDDWVIVAK